MVGGMVGAMFGDVVGGMVGAMFGDVGGVDHRPDRTGIHRTVSAKWLAGLDAPLGTLDPQVKSRRCSSVAPCTTAFRPHSP